MVIHKTFQDFVLFLYIHMALADNFLHSSEEALILDRMNKLFPTEPNPRQKYDEAVAHYRTLSSETAMKIIRATFKHFDQIKFAQKYKVYTDLYDIVNADGKVEESEMIVLEVLKEIINMNAAEVNK